MHLFVIFLKKKSTIFLILSATALTIYTSTVEPDITKPLSIMGFFALLISLIAGFSYAVLYGFKAKARRVMWSATFALYISYLVALGSLGLFSLAQFALASLAVFTLLFVVERSYAR